MAAGLAELRRLRAAAYARDEFVHAARVLLLTLGCKETRQYSGGLLVRDGVALSARLYAAALRADGVAGGYVDAVTVASGRRGVMPCALGRKDLPEVL